MSVRRLLPLAVLVAPVLSLAACETPSPAQRRLLDSMIGHTPVEVVRAFGVPTRTYSADGHETTFAGNCLGHFLMVNLLLDSVASGGRVVWTASGTHDPALLDGKTVGRAAEPDARALARQGRDGKPISGGRRYASSKLCTIMYAYELDRRLRLAGAQIASIAYDPGFLPDTGMGLGAPAIFRTSLVKSLLRKLGMTMGEMPLSGEALAMLDQDVAYSGTSGKYFHSKNGVLCETRSSVASYDATAAAKLWSDSEQLVGLKDSERPATLRNRGHSR